MNNDVLMRTVSLPAH